MTAAFASWWLRDVGVARGERPVAARRRRSSTQGHTKQRRATTAAGAAALYLDTAGETVLAQMRISPNLIQNMPVRAARENFREICLCMVQFAPLPTRYLWPHT